MDRNVPRTSRLPDPVFAIPVDDFHLPVIQLPENLFSPRLHGQHIRVYAVLGFAAPPGNMKRIPAGYMLARAIETGLLKSGDTLVEPTSGNMGVSLAFCAEKYGVTVAAIVCDALPVGKLLALKTHGARIIRESEALAKLGLTASIGSVELGKRYAEATGAICLNQYGNAWNPESYATLAAPALWKNLDGNISMLASAVGSTGTLLGIGGYLKRKNPKIEILATMPHPGQSIDGTRDRKRLAEVSHDWRSLDPVVAPIDEETARATSYFLNENGIPGGPSSGAVFSAAERFLLDKLERDTLDAMRGNDGTVSVVVPFSDTIYPYI